MRKTDAHTGKGVFRQPVRQLSQDEMLQVGGGFKNEGGPDNQARDWNKQVP